MTRREFFRRTVPMVVAGTLPLAGAHALWRKFFPEPKGWDGRLTKVTKFRLVSGDTDPWDPPDIVGLFYEHTMERMCRSFGIPPGCLGPAKDMPPYKKITLSSNHPLMKLARLEVATARRELERKLL
jgi:hypothetical protein